MPQQTHAQIIDQIASINRAIRGVNISYGSRDLPPSLTQFPATMVLLGLEDYGNRLGTCEYWIRCYVADARTGNSSRAYQDCLTLSTEFHDAYKAINFIGDRYIDRETMSAKGGFGSTGFLYTLKWGTGEFFGLQINLPLVSSIPGN
jgi:hypothetical protein